MVPCFCTPWYRLFLFLGGFMGKKLNNRKKLNKIVQLYGTIPMIYFLRDYVGINEQLSALEMATHVDVKIMNFSNVVSIPFDIVHSDDVAIGKVILVEDYKHNIGAYINPLRIEENIDKSCDSTFNRIKRRNYIDKY